MRPEKLQQLFFAPFKKCLTKDFTASISHLPKVIARILSCANQKSGSFLLAIPKTPKMVAAPFIFITMLRRRLGCNLPQLRSTSCICSRQARNDALGVHLIACNHGPERHQTHDFMVHEINSCAKACGLYSKTERTNFFRSVQH